MALHEMRRDYRMAGLTEDDVAADPFTQFRAWFAEVTGERGSEPNAMTVATADATGNPSARTVLLKQFDDRGFVFFTNYGSQKGTELAANPRAELVFFWFELERQVRIHGPVEKVTREETLAYFRSRPLGSQIGAAVSPQSQVIPDRTLLDATYAEMQEKYATEPVPLPDTWGGYRVVPE